MEGLGRTEGEVPKVEGENVKEEIYSNLKYIGCDGVSFGQRLLFSGKQLKALGEKKYNQAGFLALFCLLNREFEEKHKKSHRKSNCLPATSLLFAGSCATGFSNSVYLPFQMDSLPRHPFCPL